MACFKCKKCGKCCKIAPENIGKTGIFLTQAELDKIVEQTHREFETVKINEKTFMIVEHQDHCCFLENGLCSINEIKPKWCEVPPIVFSWFNELHGGCKGIGCGRKYSESELEEIKADLINTYGVIGGILE